MTIEAVDRRPERTILVHQGNGGDDVESLDELRLLAESAGAHVCESVLSSRPSPDPGTFIGKGKVAEIRAKVAEQAIELVVVNHDISPVQERNLEQALGCRVLDRTGLILDIFAQRAASREGKLQVELAQLRHLSTRLVRGWTHLERQKGGIGLRGPGETQLETDRRLIGQRIKHLKNRLQHVSSQRDLRRKSRRKVPIQTVCLVGYTNAGKSSLFNRLTGASVHAADQLFATLDPTMRRLGLPDGRDVVLSDTVGFIRRLPHSLVKAFHSTLEEVSSAALLLHVVDASSPERRDHCEQVRRVLAEIGAGDLPVVTVYNKIDINQVDPRLERDAAGLPSRVWVSAQTGAGIPLLLEAIAEKLGQDRVPYRVRLPVSAGKLRALLYRYGSVLAERAGDNGGWVVDVGLSESSVGRLTRHDEFGQCDFERLPVTSRALPN